jgi:DNA-binding MarR family transcriptional regulator
MTKAPVEQLRQERTPPGDPDPLTAAMVLAELGGLMIRLRRRDLSLTAEAVLVNLDRAGPGRVGDLAALAGVSQPTMTEVLSRLDRAGLVGRDPHPGDRRAVHISISDEGRAYLRLRRAETHERLLGLLNTLCPEDEAALAAAVPALRHVLAAGIASQTAPLNPDCALDDQTAP